jgi:GNAT superfamily N-acetyltransferase
VPTTSVTRTYLELNTPAQLVGSGPAPFGARIEAVTDCPPAFYRWLYTTVGGPWHWRDRLHWDDDTIRRHVGEPSVLLRVLHVEGTPAGYYELNRHADGAVEVKYIGLVPEYIGRGLGGYLVSAAAAEAWALGARRVILDTCTLDGPAALPNYLKRGFTAYRTEEYEVELPAAAT